MSFPKLHEELQISQNASLELLIKVYFLSIFDLNTENMKLQVLIENGQNSSSRMSPKKFSPAMIA